MVDFFYWEFSLLNEKRSFGGFFPQAFIFVDNWAEIRDEAKVLIVSFLQVSGSFEKFRIPYKRARWITKGSNN